MSGIENRTLKDTVEGIRNAFRAYIPNSDAWLFPNNLWITATALGGFIWEIYARIRWAFGEYMPDSASGFILERWGNIFGIYRKLATKSGGNIIVTGVPGTLVPAGTTWTRSDGAIFVSLNSESVGAGGDVLIAVESEEVGTTQNTEPNAPLQIASVIADIDDEANVDENGLGGGSNDECDEEFRERILEAMRTRYFVGTLKDWEFLALSYPGVTRVFPEDAGAGFVDIWFMVDGATPDGIPLPVDVTNLQAYLDDPCRRPLGSTPVVRQLTGKFLDVTIECLTPDTPELRTAIENELNQWLLKNASPQQTIAPSTIETVIQSVSSEVKFNLIQDGNFFTLEGEIFTLAAVNYV